jgi:acyl-CoA reductase-like NAD-dependent aldehyde dehydrogenase
LSTLYFAALVAELVPPGVLNVIADTGELGARMTAHPDIAKITFTGSTATGRRVMASAAETLKRITLELGGNDPAIVLGDADPKAIAPKLFNAAFRNTGQLCIAIKRIYADAAIYDALCDELAALADKAKVGDGFEPDVEFGPLQNKLQYDLVAALIDEARSVGRVIAGGVVTGRPGYFIRPTIVRDISDGARLVDEEQFGPVLPIVKFTDPDDAVRRANALPFGLGASVWSADPERAHAIGVQIESGTVWINHHGELAPDVPFAGAKTSGLGVELGREGLMEFTQLQVINSAKTVAPLR